MKMNIIFQVNCPCEVGTRREGNYPASCLFASIYGSLYGFGVQSDPIRNRSKVRCIKNGCILRRGTCSHILSPFKIGYVEAENKSGKC